MTFQEKMPHIPKIKTTPERVLEEADLSAEALAKEAKAERKAERKERETIELQEAKELFSEDFFGPEEVEKTWGFQPEEVPEIPFSREELERAKEMRQMLILRVEQTKDGKPMSLETINNILVEKWGKEDKGKILWKADDWKDSMIGEDRFKKEAPRSGWALVSKDLLPNSTDKNYIEQTEVIIKALREEAFKDIEVPEEYEEAIREFEANKDRLTKLVSTNWQEAAKQLSELKITKLTRQTFSETIYDVAMYHDRHNKRLLKGKKYTWSASLDPDDGNFVFFGNFDSNGVSCGCWGPRHSLDTTLGVSLSRRL